MGNVNRRRNKRMAESQGEFSLKRTIYISGIILVLGVIAFLVTIMIYNNNLNKFYSELDTKEIGEAQTENAGEQEEQSEATSMNLGKTVDEMESAIKEASAENEEAKQTNAQQEKKTETKTNTETKNKEENTNTNTIKQEEVKKETEEVKELKFIMPVEGEIQKEYAKDKLVYSETLKEWVTHTGIDIKAEKTTVVKASEEGTVTAIKNDPRYGTTIIVEHKDGYETRYANLLTAEFVSIGEKVTKGQTIGTVGDTGSFEILDEAHLHFELLRNGEYQDPSSIIK